MLITTASPRAQTKGTFWLTAGFCALTFWLSGSIILDAVVMPSLYIAGMTNEPGFAVAGHTLFSTFNHIELICAAVVLCTTLVITLQGYKHHISQSQQMLAFGLAWMLFGIALVYTYVLTPVMSGIGLSLDLFTTPSLTPQVMGNMHSIYWFLEAVKILAAAELLWLCMRAGKPRTGL